MKDNEQNKIWTTRSSSNIWLINN